MKGTRSLRNSTKQVGNTKSRILQCVNCHNKSNWLSVDGLCWNCLKEAVKMKKPLWIQGSPDQNLEGGDQAVPEWPLP